MMHSLTLLQKQFESYTKICFVNDILTKYLVIFVIVYVRFYSKDDIVLTDSSVIELSKRGKNKGMGTTEALGETCNCRPQLFYYKYWWWYCMIVGELQIKQEVVPS